MGNASAFDLDALDTRIRELVAYARERDGEDRTLLFRNLVDLFLTGKAPKKQPTRDQLLDVIEALIPHVEPDGRRTVADLIANLANPPLDLAYRLAKDRPHIVGDLLRSTAFDEDDIIELIARTGREHHHVIASRNDLSANVWIALARAAPAAPPFDNQSTLALWRDDLGGEYGDETIMPFRAKQDETTIENMPAPPQAENRTRSASQGTALGSKKQEATKQGATEQPDNMKEADPSDTKHTAELRILRTDKDLIADRIAKSDEKMQTVSEFPQETTTSTEQNHRSRPAVSIAPGSGKWSWQSDRDGLVLDVSSNGTSLFQRSTRLVGNSVLDLLGLSNKLGHPVSRAFQRRSAIHDAPIALKNDDVKLRFWTLEATPVFSAGDGVFEGYDGVMTPISAHDQPGLGLPDQKPQAASALHAIIDENIDRTTMPAPEPMPTPTPTPTPESMPEPAPINRTKNQAPTAQTANSANVHQTIQSQNNQPLTDIASEVLKDLIGDSVAAALSNNLRERQAELAKASADSARSENDLRVTLQIMEETLGNLIEASRTSGNTSVRLQTEIATACLKTLKDQLADK